MPEPTSVVTIKDWTISSVTFEQGATLIQNPATSNSINGAFTMSAIAFTSSTITYGKLFLFGGTFTSNPVDSYGFKIDNIDLS